MKGRWKEEACSFLWKFRLFWGLTTSPDKYASELNQQTLALSSPQLLQFYLSLKPQYNHLKPTKRRETCHMGGEAHLWEWIECCKQVSCVFLSTLFKQALICLRIPLQFRTIAPILLIFGTDSVPGMLATC